MKNRLTDDETMSTFNLAIGNLNESEFHWIADSSLTQRAYLLGVYNTLTLLGNISSIKGELLISLSETLYAKTGDNFKKD